MNPVPDNEATYLLHRWQGGDASAADALLPLVYNDLRRMARFELARHSGHDTLQPTALVNDVFVQLLGQDALGELENRLHFFRLSARVMRQLLVARARASAAAKRGGDWQRCDLSTELLLEVSENTEIQALDDALAALAAIEPQLAQVVELRMFGGFSMDEVATLMEVDERTVYRHWALAKAWLRRRLSE